MTLNWFRASLAAVGSMAIAASPSRADYVATSMDTATPIMTISVPARGMNGEAGYVGPNSVSYDGGPAAAAYCTDLFRTIAANDRYDASEQPLSGLANGAFVARLFAADAATGDAGPLEHAALQLAIWDSVEAGRAGLGDFVDPLGFDAGRVDRGPDHFNVYTDGTKSTLLFGLSSSALVVDAADGSGVADRMSRLLLAAEALSGPGADLTYLAPGTSYGQGFVKVRSVPEPSALLLSGIGLIGLLGLHFRRKLAARPVAVAVVVTDDARS